MPTGFTTYSDMCSKCGELRDGAHQLYCKSCLRQYARTWRANNRERFLQKSRDYYAANKDKHRTYRERSRYKIDPEAFRAQKMEEQEGRCGICRVLFSETKRGAFIDHDHRTDSPRGLLCDHCNRLIGDARENPDTLASAISYLAMYSEGIR